ASPRSTCAPRSWPSAATRPRSTPGSSSSSRSTPTATAAACARPPGPPGSPHADTFRNTVAGMSGCKRIAILTSGGDAPGMNAAIRAAALVGQSLGAEMLGVERGYKGLLEDAIVPLAPGDVAGILREGGTILGSARCKEFHQREVRDKARAVLAER